jgi:hypothetical protein
MSGRLAFNLLLLAVAAYFVWSATGYEPQARLIPMIIGVMVLVLQSWVTVREAVVTEMVPAAESIEPPPPADEVRHVAAMCGWMLLYLVLFAMIGTLAATLLFILLFLLMQPGVRWWTALAVAAATSATIWLLFVRLMRFELYPGVLFGSILPPL